MNIAAEHGGGLELVTDDREGGVVGGARAADQRVGEGVTRIAVGGGEGADDRTDGLVLGDGRA